jgi:predicted RNA-binding protein YlxR (DUF448 family)
MAAETERQCLLTRVVKPKAAMLRFVVGPEGQLVADLASNLPGRGMWLSASKLLLADAISKRAFSRAAKKPVSVAEDFTARLELLWQRRLLDTCSLARKAGQAISGFDKVQVALNKGEVLLLLQASDAGEDGVKKLRPKTIPVYRGFSRDQLSVMAGRENAVHLAILEGSAGRFFLEELRRFALFMDETGL